MRGGSDGDSLGSRIDAGRFTKPENRWELRRKSGSDAVARVEADGAPALQLLENRASNDVARCEFGVAMHSEHESFAEIVDQRRAFSAHRFGYEGHRIGADRECRRMELHELHIRKRRAGARGHCDAVARRFDRVRRVPVQSSDAARSENDRGGNVRAGYTGCVVVRVNAAHASVLDDEVVGGSFFYNVNRFHGTDCRDERFENFMARCIAAGLDDSSPLVRGFATESKFARIRSIEGCSEFEQFFDACGGVARENVDDLFVVDAGARAIGIECVKGR